MSISKQDFEFMRDYLKKQIGLAITQDKEYLLESRLVPIGKQHKLHSLAQLVAALKSPGNTALHKEVCEAMTTNESLFFRDQKPFDAMKKTLLPQLRKNNEASKRLRIWSAACSTGQEPYSVAMTLLEEGAGGAGWSYEIVGTDIADKVLERARAGVYTQFEVQRGLPIQLLMKYFSPNKDTSWTIKDQLKSMVSFKNVNLLADFSLSMGKFDLILCRNVLIYFDEETKSQIVQRLCRCLNPGGVLIIGGSESIMQSAAPVVPIPETRGIYQLKAA